MAPWALGRRRSTGTGAALAGVALASVLVAALAGAVASAGMPLHALAAAASALLAALTAAVLAPRLRSVLVTWGLGLALLVAAAAACAVGCPPRTSAAGLLVCSLLGAPAAPRVALAVSGLGARASSAAWAQTGLGAHSEPSGHVEASRSARSQEGLAGTVGQARSAVLGVIAAAVTVVALGAAGLALRWRRVPTRAAAATAAAGGTLAAVAVGALGDPRVATSVLALGLLAAGRCALPPGPVTPGVVRALDALDTLVQVAALPLAVVIAL